MEWGKDEEPLITISKNPKGGGGFRTLPFILASQAFEKMANFGIVGNMILYLTRHYGMEAAFATNVILLWSAATNFTPILAAFIADSYVGRYHTIAFGSLVNLLGMLLFWLTAAIRELSPCDQLTKSCSSPSTAQLTFLYSSLGIMSIGAGGVRASSLAFGIDQIGKEDRDARIRESYFSWIVAIITISVFIGMSVLVYIQESLGWTVGFGVSVVLMFMSMVSFLLPSSLYVKLEPKGNVISECAQVIAASYKNRHLKLPQLHASNDKYYCDKDSAIFLPSDKLRFLNKACLIKNPQEDLTQDGSVKHPWNLCTVDQVEAIKAVIKIVPIWITGMIMPLNLSQGSLFILEASSMDRHITSHFEIPAASVATVVIISTLLWIILYDRVIIPFASKVRGVPTRLKVKQKMGVGLFAVCLSTALLAVVEGIRRKKAIDEGLSEYPEGVVNMSVLWLTPKNFIDGFAEAFNAVGQVEFYICELPQSMSSIASNLSGLGTSCANLIATLILSVVDNVTKGDGNVSWVSSNINKGHLDYYYWLIFGLMLANFLSFIYFSKAYGPCKGEENESQEETN